MSFRLFSFGTLRDDEVLEVVLGRSTSDIERIPARLRGYRVARLPDESYPVLIESDGDAVEGLLLCGLTELDFDRISFFENAEYGLETCRVELADSTEVEAVFCSEGATNEGPRTPWTLEDWQRTEKQKFMEIISRYMKLFGCMTPEEADGEWNKWKSQ